MRRDATVSAVAATLALATTAAAAGLPQPPINGVVVEDVIRPYSIDVVGLSFEGGPWFHEDEDRGTVRSMVILAPDKTYDFYFHITRSAGGGLQNFDFTWQVPGPSAPSGPWSKTAVAP